MKTYKIEVTFFIDAENKEDAKEKLEDGYCMGDSAYIKIEEDETTNQR